MPFSKERTDYTGDKVKGEMTTLDFIETKMEIHGRMGTRVYRHKCNGEAYDYAYEHRPKYDPTVLSRRPECVFRCAAKFTNSSQPGYHAIIDKMYYYTPFFIIPGSYGFTCNTFLMLRKRKDYLIQIDDGIKLEMRLAPRSMLKMNFDETGEHIIRCFKGNELYCERKIVVIEAEMELANVYAQWFEEHLLEILALPDPQFVRLEKYFRCVLPPNWIKSYTGQYADFVLYSTRKSFMELGIAKYNYMYIRNIKNLHSNDQSEYFAEVQPRIANCWKGVSGDFQEVWEKYFGRWFGVNYLGDWRNPRKHNFWSKLIFRAAKVLGFDLESLSIEHFLPEVETLGDLITLTGMGHYGLGEEELKTKIF